ncbi:hypothetical protein CapIbe_008253 [Capra ibex]
MTLLFKLFDLRRSGGLPNSHFINLNSTWFQISSFMREKLSDGQLCGKTACGESSYGKNTLTKTTMTITLLRNALKIGSTFHSRWSLSWEDTNKPLKIK